MNEFKITGGAVVGMAHATWPFATLTADEHKLQLNASLFGKFIFTRDDIISFEPYVLMGKRGLQIKHKVANYNSKIVFLSSQSASHLVSQIQETGFLNSSRTLSPYDNLEISAAQSSSGFPLKTMPTVIIVVIWNLFCILGNLNLFSGEKRGPNFGVGIPLATAFLFLSCLAMLVSEPFSRLILKEGRTVSDIRLSLYFLMFVAAVLFSGFTFFLH